MRTVFICKTKLIRVLCPRQALVKKLRVPTHLVKLILDLGDGNLGTGMRTVHTTLAWLVGASFTVRHFFRAEKTEVALISSTQMVHVW